MYAGCLGDLHATLDTKPINRLDDVDHVALARFGCEDAKIHTPAVDVRCGFLPGTREPSGREGSSVGYGCIR